MTPAASCSPCRAVGRDPARLLLTLPGGRPGPPARLLLTLPGGQPGPPARTAGLRAASGWNTSRGVAK
jgi:hypothetical protein